MIHNKVVLLTIIAIGYTSIYSGALRQFRIPKSSTAASRNVMQPQRMQKRNFNTISNTTVAKPQNLLNRFNQAFKNKYQQVVTNSGAWFNKFKNVVGASTVAALAGYLVNETTQQVAAAENEVERIQKSLGQSYSTTIKDKAYIKRLEDEIDRGNEAVRQELEQKRQELTDKLTDIQAKEAELAQKQQQLEIMQAGVEEGSKYNEEVRQTLTATSQDLEQQRTDIATQKSELANAQQELENTKADDNNQRAQLLKEIESKRAAIEAQEKQLKDEQKVLAAMRSPQPLARSASFFDLIAQEAPEDVQAVKELLEKRNGQSFKDQAFDEIVTKGSIAQRNLQRLYDTIRTQHPEKYLEAVGNFVFNPPLDDAEKTLQSLLLFGKEQPTQLSQEQRDTLVKEIYRNAQNEFQLLPRDQKIAWALDTQKLLDDMYVDEKGNLKNSGNAVALIKHVGNPLEWPLKTNSDLEKKRQLNLRLLNDLYRNGIYNNNTRDSYDY